jgi:hypothetical protein
VTRALKLHGARVVAHVPLKAFVMTAARVMLSLVTVGLAAAETSQNVSSVMVFHKGEKNYGAVVYILLALSTAGGSLHGSARNQYESAWCNT